MWTSPSLHLLGEGYKELWKRKATPSNRMARGKRPTSRGHLNSRRGKPVSGCTEQFYSCCATMQQRRRREGRQWAQLEAWWQGDHWLFSFTPSRDTSRPSKSSVRSSRNAGTCWWGQVHLVTCVCNPVVVCLCSAVCVRLQPTLPCCLCLRSVYLRPFHHSSKGVCCCVFIIQLRVDRWGMTCNAMSLLIGKPSVNWPFPMAMLKHQKL